MVEVGWKERGYMRRSVYVDRGEGRAVREKACPHRTREGVWVEKGDGWTYYYRGVKAKKGP